jgi:hypothetical protein
MPTKCIEFGTRIRAAAGVKDHGVRREGSRVEFRQRRTELSVAHGDEDYRRFADRRRERPRGDRERPVAHRTTAMHTTDFDAAGGERASQTAPRPTRSQYEETQRTGARSSPERSVSSVRVT